MKRLLALLLTLTMLLTFAGCSGGEETDTSGGGTTTEQSGGADSTQLPEDMKIAYAAVTTSLAPWAIALANSMQEICSTNGWELEVYDGEGNPTTQTEQISSIISDGEADLVVLFPADSEVAATYVSQLNAADIPVITMGSDVVEEGHDGVICYVGPDQDGMVSYGANYIIDKFGEDSGSNYVVLAGWEAQYDYVLRVAAVDKYFADTNYNRLALEYCGASRQDALDIMANLLTANSEIDFVFALSDEFALGAIQAIEEAGREGEITVVSLEAFEEGLDAITNGQMDLTVTMRADKVVEKLESVLLTLIDGGTVEYEQHSEIVEVTSENVSGIEVEY